MDTTKSLAAIVIYPGVCLMEAYVGFSKALKSLKEGTEEDVPQAFGPRRIFQVCGMDQIEKFDHDVSDWVQAFEHDNETEPNSTVR